MSIRNSITRISNANFGPRSLTKLTDKNLQERLESSRLANEEASNEQSTIIKQMKTALDGHTSSLQTQGNAIARLAEQMYDRASTLEPNVNHYQELLLWTWGRTESLHDESFDSKFSQLQRPR